MNDTETKTAAEPVIAATPESASRAVTVIDQETSHSLSVFSSVGNFEIAQRMAKALAASSMVPTAYRGNVPNCMVALDIVARVRAPVLLVMQNLYVIEGKPSWASVFLGSSVNACGRFSPIRYEIVGTDPMAKEYRVRAFATELETGDKLYGAWITWAMVDGEGWSQKKGSKWKTMPEQMFRYRATAFWTRTFAPEITLGMLTAEEVEDMPRMAGPRNGSPLNAAVNAEAEIMSGGPSATPITDDEIVVPEAPEPVVDSDEDILAQDRETAAREAKP